MNSSTISNSEKRKNTLPYAFLIALAAILAIEFLNARFDDYFYTTETKTAQATATGLDGFRMKIKNNYALTTDKGFDVIVLGDSFNGSGIMPDIIEKDSGLTVFNFSSFGDHGVFASYCMFKNYLKRTAHPPKFLVMGFQVDTLARPDINPSFMYDFKQGNAVELISEFGLSDGLKFLIPSLKHQALFRRVLKDGRVPEIMPAGKIADFRKSVILDRGFYAPNAYNASAQPVTEAQYNQTFRFRFSETSSRNLRNILNLARARGIRVIYIVPSFSYDWLELYLNHGVIKRYQYELSQIKNEYPDLKIISYQKYVNRLDMYSDRLHVNINGSRITSHLLGLYLADLNQK